MRNIDIDSWWRRSNKKELTEKDFTDEDIDDSVVTYVYAEEDVSYEIFYYLRQHTFDAVCLLENGEDRSSENSFKTFEEAVEWCSTDFNWNRRR